MIDQVELEKILKGLEIINGIKEANICSKSGLKIATLSPEKDIGRIAEIVALSATMFGAAETVTLRSELNLPTEVISFSSNGCFMIVGVGRKALLVASVESDKWNGHILAELHKASEKIKQILE